MFVERKMESVLRDAIEEVVASGTEIRTFFAEPDYSDGDEKLSLPLVVIGSAPGSRETGHQSQRTQLVLFRCMTHINDDENRSQLRALYEAVRKCVETTAFDFGSNIEYTANSYMITAVGDMDSEQNAYYGTEFMVEFPICAEAFSWVEE